MQENGMSLFLTDVTNLSSQVELLIVGESTGMGHVHHIVTVCDRLRGLSRRHRISRSKSHKCYI